MGCSGPTERWWRWEKATWPHLSPLFFQPLSSDVNHETGCSKTTQTRRERESLLQFSFSHITFLDRPPCLTWKYMLRDPSPKGKSGVTAWADTPQWQQEPEAIWGESREIFVFPCEEAGEGNGTPLLPGKSHGRRNLVGCRPWCR